MKQFVSITVALVLSVIIITGLFAQSPMTTYIWVSDLNDDDSVFEYIDNNIVIQTQNVYYGYDLEGLACLNNIVYASSGKNGKVTSKLFTVDVQGNISTLKYVGDLQNATQTFKEVAALSEKSDGTLWGFANSKPNKGIIAINPSNGQSTMVHTTDIKVEGIEWLDETLYLVGDNNLYVWSVGKEIQLVHTFDFDEDELEALDVQNGKLVLSSHGDNDTNFYFVNPTTFEIVNTIKYTNANDVEGLTTCEINKPVPVITLTATETPVATITATSTQVPVATNTIVPNITKTVVPPTITATTVTATPTNTMTQPYVTITPEPTETLIVLPPTNETEEAEPPHYQIFLPNVSK